MIPDLELPGEFEWVRTIYQDGNAYARAIIHDDTIEIEIWPSEIIVTSGCIAISYSDPYNTENISKIIRSLIASVMSFNDKWDSLSNEFDSLEVDT